MPTRTQLKRQIKDAIIVSLPMRTVSIHDINLEQMVNNIIAYIEKNCAIIDKITGNDIIE